MVKKLLERAKTISLVYIMLGILVGSLETLYFGNNFFPKSDAEVIWDIISSALFFSGIGGYAVSKTILKKL